MEESSTDITDAVRIGPASVPERFLQLLGQVERESAPPPVGDTFSTLSLSVELMEKFGGKDQRSTVIISAARLETLLGDLPESYLLPKPSSNSELLTGMGPLSSFSARLNLVHRLGFIDEELWRTIRLIKDTRNEFTHEVSPGTFEKGAPAQRIEHIFSPLEDTNFFILEAMEHKLKMGMRKYIHDNWDELIEEEENGGELDVDIKDKVIDKAIQKSEPIEPGKFSKFKATVIACVTVLELGVKTTDTHEKPNEPLDLSIVTGFELEETIDNSTDQFKSLVEGKSSLYPRVSGQGEGFVIEDVPWSKNPLNPDAPMDEVVSRPAQHKDFPNSDQSNDS